MGTGRLEAFTDGVIAIIITIMVLEMKVPADASLPALVASFPMLAAYALSYANIGLIWNNHHHMLHAADKINGRILWANLLLLFWMSLVPLVIRWMNETHFAGLPTSSYGAVFTMIAISYLFLERSIVAHNGPTSKLARAVGGDTKSKISLLIYLLAIPCAFWKPSISIALYIVNASIWFVPDRRIEEVF